MSEPALNPDAPEQAAGWYGKIPALGDFASRRLPQEFIGAWDGWLQRGMDASRAALGAGWQEIYLSCPVWRFILLPGACGEQAWAGVMMPSVDKVGRHFPLTIAAPVAGSAASPVSPVSSWGIFSATDWFDAIERAALACLDLACAVETLESRLAAIPPPMRPEPAGQELPAAAALAGWWRADGDAALSLAMPGPASFPAVVGAGAMQLLYEAGRGRSMWWHFDELADAACLRGFHGLPPAAAFTGLMEGFLPDRSQDQTDAQPGPLS